MTRGRGRNQKETKIARKGKKEGDEKMGEQKRPGMLTKNTGPQ